MLYLSPKSKYRPSTGRFTAAPPNTAPQGTYRPACPQFCQALKAQKFSHLHQFSLQTALVLGRRRPEQPGQARILLIIMTSRPESAGSSLSHSSSSPFASFAFATSFSRPSSLREASASNAPPKNAVADAHPSHSRPGLVSRASASSPKGTTRPRHLHTHSKSSSVIPTLSTLTHWQPTKSMATSNGGASAGAADLLRQAMMQRYVSHRCCSVSCSCELGLAGLRGKSESESPQPQAASGAALVIIA